MDFNECGRALDDAEALLNEWAERHVAPLDLNVLSNYPYSLEQRTVEFLSRNMQREPDQRRIEG